MDLMTRVTSYSQGNHTWLASAHATDTGDTVTLDLSTFTKATHFPNGFIPSGMPLGKITANSRFGLYGASPNEQQTLTFDATGGTFDLTFDGETVSGITYANAAGDAATIQAALEGLSSINVGDVTVVRGTPAGNVTIFTVTFGGQYAGVNVPAISVAESLTGGSGTLVPATSVAGGGSVSDGRETMQGHLLHDVKVETDNESGLAVATIIRHCMVKESNLPANHTLDAAGKADVKGAIIYV